MTRLATALGRGLDGALGLLLLVIVAVALAQVVARYVLNASLVWSEELSRLLFIWLIMLGAVGGSPMRIGLLADNLPRPWRVALRVLAAGVSLGLLGLLVYGAYAMVDLTRYDRYTGLGWPVSYAFWGVVVGSSLWLVALVAKLWLRRGGDPW
ncbi:MAG: TRAP transporter small permease [Candidatus Competibacterales bacterium]